MESPIFALTALLKYGAWVVLLIGGLLFHLRLRTLSSLSYLISSVAITFWSHLGRSMFFNAVAPQSAGGLATMGHAEAAVALVDAALALWLGVSFLVAVMAIRRADRQAA